MSSEKNCPFQNKICSSECALYIAPQELNETVKNKLASIGIIDRENGLCSLKNLSMCLNRFMFEQTSGFNKK